MTLRSFLSFICSTPAEGSRLLVATNTRFTNGHWRQAASPPHLVRGCWERTVQRGWCRDVLSGLEERELTGPEGENEYIQIILKQTTTGYRVWPTCSTVFSCLGLDYVRASRICLQRSCMFDILTCFLIILYILIGVSWQITKRSLRKEIKSSAITSSINSKSGSQSLQAMVGQRVRQMMYSIWARVLTGYTLSVEGVLEGVFSLAKDQISLLQTRRGRREDVAWNFPCKQGIAPWFVLDGTGPSTSYNDRTYECLVFNHACMPWNTDYLFLLLHIIRPSCSLSLFIYIYIQYIYM